VYPAKWTRCSTRPQADRRGDQERSRSNTTLVGHISDTLDTPYPPIDVVHDRRTQLHRARDRNGLVRDPPLAVVPSVLRANAQDPSEVTEAGSFLVSRGVANESSETLTAPFTGSRCLAFEFEVTERQPFGIGIPWFQAHLDDGVATRPFTLNGPLEALTVVPSAKRFALDTGSTIITVGASESPPERIQRFVDVRDNLNPVARWIQVLPGLAHGATSNAGSILAKSISSRDARNNDRTRSSSPAISSSPTAPETIRDRTSPKGSVSNGDRVGFHHHRIRRCRFMTDRSSTPLSHLFP